MFNCPHTGVALAVLKKLVARKQVEAGQRVIVISTYGRGMWAMDATRLRSSR